MKQLTNTHGYKLLLTLCSMIVADATFANGKSFYEVTITKVTNELSFMPPLVATHDKRVSLFELGLPTEIIAEACDTGSLTDALNGLDRHIQDVTAAPGLLGPGQTVSVTAEANGFDRYLSIIAMTILTNANFLCGLCPAITQSGRSGDCKRGYDGYRA